MRRAGVYYQEELAGWLEEDDQGFAFFYDKSYLMKGHPGVSLTLPPREEPYRSDRLFPFFDGLIPEGWLLSITEKNWKINSRDRMGLLLVCCRDCIGAVSLLPAEDKNG